MSWHLLQPHPSAAPEVGWGLQAFPNQGKKPRYLPISAWTLAKEEAAPTTSQNPPQSTEKPS